MNIEEAKEILDRIDIKFFLSGMIEQNNYIVDKADEVNTAIYTVLNELNKNDAEITQLKKREWLIKYKLERDIEIYSQDGCCRKQVREGRVREAKEILELVGDDK